MKWLKDQLNQLWFWIFATSVFLIIVQVLFRVEAPCKWLEAVWEAGDLISFFGTLVLGFIAVRQTQQANDMASNANKTSMKLIELQKAEYTPVVTIKEFTGITKHALRRINSAPQSEIIVHEMHCSDDEILVGYSISLIDKNFDTSKHSYCRDYEMHLNYSGHFVVESFQIKEIRFCGNDFERTFKIKNTLEMSLGNGESFTLFLFLFSNEDFLQKKSNAYQYLSSQHIIFEMELKSISGTVYTETLKIRKHLVCNPNPKLNCENAEMLVSASYQVAQDVSREASSN